MQHHRPTDTERFDYTDLSSERPLEPAAAPVRTSSALRATFVMLAILAVMAALGVYEFSLVRDHWLDRALEIAGKQLWVGLFALSIGGLLDSPPLRGDSPAPPPLRGAFGKLILVAGGILAIAAFAGLLYLAAIEFGVA